jgi:hypothetical protein
MPGTSPDREAKVIGATVGGAAASSWLGHEVAVEVKKHGF